MNFSESFQTVALVMEPCFRVTFIFSSDNHKSNDNFSFTFSISIELFLWFWRVAFLKFLDNWNKESVVGSIFFKPQFLGAETFFEEFFGISRTNNQ